MKRTSPSDVQELADLNDLKLDAELTAQKYKGYF